MILGFAMDIALLTVVTGPRLRAGIIPEPPSLALRSDHSRGWRVTEKVTNPGNVHTQVQGVAEILDLDLRLVSKAPLEVGKGYVLPGGQREFSAAGNQTLKEGLYTIRVRLGPRGEQPRTNAVRVVRVEKGGLVNANVPPEALAAARAALGGFVVENPELVFELASGSRRAGALRLRSRTTEEQTLTPHLLRWWVDQSGSPVFPKTATLHDASGWLTVSPSTVVLPANGRASVRVEAAVPREAAVGEYFAAVAFANAGEKLPEGASVLEEKSATVTVSVGKVGKPILSVGNLKVSLRKGEGLTIAFQVANRGLARVWPKARVSIADSSGQRLEPEISLAAEELPIMPGGFRSYSARWDRLLPSGSYTASVYVENEGLPSPITARVPFTVPRTSGSQHTRAKGGDKSG